MQHWRSTATYAAVTYPEAVNISNKCCSITFGYSIGSHIVSWSQKVKYFSVIINSKLKWNDHCPFIVSKATKCLNHTCFAMYGCTQAAKVNTYKALVRMHLEYACAVWSPNMPTDISLLESVQHRAARWILSFRDSSANKWSKSSIICVIELGWPSLKAHQECISIWTLYSIIYKKTAIDFSKHFCFNTLSTRSHSFTLSLVSSTINAFRHSFFVAAPILWNSIPLSVLS